MSFKKWKELNRFEMNIKKHMNRKRMFALRLLVLFGSITFLIDALLFWGRDRVLCLGFGIVAIILFLLYLNETFLNRVFKL